MSVFQKLLAGCYQVPTRNLVHHNLVLSPSHFLEGLGETYYGYGPGFGTSPYWPADSASQNYRFYPKAAPTRDTLEILRIMREE